MRLIALASFLILAAFFAPVAAATNTDRCSAVVDNYTYRPSDRNFVQVIDFLNGQVSRHVVARGSNVSALKAAKPLTRNIEVLKVEVASMVCGTALANHSATKAGLGMTANLGCNYVGCTESLPPDFDTVPDGGTVSITSCGGGIQTTSNYQKQSDGTYMMTGYKTEQVTQCDPM